LPLLSKVAKRNFIIPASSSKNKRVFSCGGSFVSKKRNKLAPKKLEDMMIIKENKSTIQAFKAKNTSKLMKPLIMTKKTAKYFSMSMMKTQTQTLRKRRRKRRRWRKSWISYTM